MSWRLRFWCIEAEQVGLVEPRFHLMMNVNELLFSILVSVFKVTGNSSELLPTYL